MREILFRGKRKDNGEWVHGDLVRTTRASDGIKSDHSLIGVDMDSYEVIPDTVGQLVGITDFAGTEIYEHDIVAVTCAMMNPSGDYSGGYKVSYDPVNCSFMLVQLDDMSAIEFNEVDYYEVIGNAHDNPEL